MSSHQLAIAKLSFSAGLLRPDPTSLPREAIAHFHSLLNAAVQQCSPSNVQTCKQWVVQNVFQSTARFAALGKYLIALAASFAEAARSETPSTKREPSIRRRRLHILYILNDILHHAKYHIHDASISSKVQPILVDLIKATASFKDCPKHQRKVLDLLGLWEEKGYYSTDYIDKLRETARHASELGGLFSEEAEPSGDGTQESTVKVTKVVPYVMPASHGDSSTPWFDLPAGNLMLHIVPNSTRPINPESIKPLQFVAGPADESLVFAVKALLDDVEKIFGVEEEEDGLIADIDELGQPIILDELTGDVVGGEGYYGWSKTFCEKMKRRRRGIQEPNEEDDRGRRSRSSSQEPRKRRFSGSDRSSVSDRRRRRRRSYSSSRSPSTDDDRRGSRAGRPRSPFNAPYEASHQSPPKPPTPSYPVPPALYPLGMNPNFPPPPPPQPLFGNQGPPYGNWAPPPPPPPLHNMAFNNGQQQQPYGSWPPPPPPIPAPTMAPNGWQNHQPQGRGYSNNNNNNGWQGRGGRGGYRGRGW